MKKRTDLALEAKQLWERSAGKTSRLEGVAAQSSKRFRFKLTKVDILNDKGVEALGKPVGQYITMELGSQELRGRDSDHAARTLSELLGGLMRLKKDESVLVVGLGNREVTPDAIGPSAVSGILLTRHLIRHLPNQFGSFRSVCAVCPGVLGSTGFESLELVIAAMEKSKPDKVVVIDALASCDADRLLTTIQLTDTGIVPGSGIGNSRAAFNKNTVGVPVFAIGVPTVMDLDACSADVQKNNLMVTPRNIDALVRSVSKIVANGINQTLYDRLSSDEIAQFV